MVDSINGTGGVPPVNNAGRAQSRSETRNGDTISSPISTDEVSISSEALEIARIENAQAEEAALQDASNARIILEERLDAALTSDNVAAALNALDVGE